MRFITYLSILTCLSGCGATLQEMISKTQEGEPYETYEPTEVFEAVGSFEAGRFTIAYCPVELVDSTGKLLHPEVTRDQRRALIEEDRKFIFDIKDSPLRGLGQKVNLLLAKEPCRVTLDAAGVKALEARPKASDLVDIWQYHNFFEGLAAAHPSWLGEDLQMVYQIPHGLRDQATWFRFDRAANFATAAMGAWDQKDWASFVSFLQKTANEEKGGTSLTAIANRMLSLAGPDGVVNAAFPKLQVPLVWHAVGGGKPGIKLSNGRAGVPHSSVILFHELGHIGECRAADGYSEESAANYFKENPREAAVVEFLGRNVTLADIGEAAGKVLAEHKLLPEVIALGLGAQVKSALEGLKVSEKEVNVSGLLLGNGFSTRAVGKVLGEPNVLPDDPKVQREVWFKVPGFSDRLWNPESKKVPEEGDVRIIKGGLYLEGQAFSRIQVRKGGEWRNTFMAQSGSHDAPVGPVLGACLTRLAKKIDARQ
ncbi:MAG: hypothetical protein ACE366_00050 [Bradymonadia bacterium]